MAIRTFEKQQFEEVYKKLILNGGFFEFSNYYHIYKSRYYRSLKCLASLDLPRPAEILEFGGGQIGLLCSEMFGDHCTIADVSDRYSDVIRKAGLGFVSCDLLYDDLPPGKQYDAIVMLEVVEHLPVPLHMVLSKLMRRLKPGGLVFLTTPNLYRFRNLVRFVLGREIFAMWRYPGRGNPTGHVLEFDEQHLRLQLAHAGLEQTHIELVQLAYGGATRRATLLRAISSPFILARPLWRDHLIAWARKPVETTVVDSESVGGNPSAVVDAKLCF